MAPKFNQDLDSTFAAKQLEYLRAAALDPALAPLKSRQLIPTNNEVPEGAESFTYRQWNIYGKAEWLGDKATDLPTVNSDGKETTVKPYTFGTSFDISRQEMLAAQYGGVPLDQRLALAARRAVEEFFDTVAATGATVHNLLGLVNQTGTCTYTVPADGTGASKLWSTKTGAQIARDMHGCAQQIITDTKEVETPDTLLLPPDEYALIATTRFNDYTEASILDAFLKTSPYIKQVVQWTPLADCVAGPLNRMIAYRRSSEVLEHVIPAEFKMMPSESQNGGLNFHTACIGRTAGVVIYRPKAVAYADGI